MKIFIYLLILFFSINSFGQDNELIKSDLLGCWTDSREENSSNSNINIYRPCDFKIFPVSRFRFKMDLKKDSNCSWYYLAPNDGHKMKDGTWTFNSEKNVLKIFNLDNGEIKSFIIEQVDENILKINN